ncbi:SAM-dependent methyltransferase [Pelagicoccus sp. SDUM812002]|uniref:SAM-dependent methyltransferase n=1 Tax=Pelagicoccus sp. SDUM812002 TaxID=3041266 RepID=UPI00280D9517|nr:SAM-dependent methyltransferase [Pelagicoccus sp. SDUM812002]MDQ8187856.1 SAM-dependent methyltransferase [Pelagicoccus sp. SDUM812002]
MSDLPEQPPEILTALANKAGPDGIIELPDFIETALYHPQYGYYRREQHRVGRNPQSDFYTSISLKESFAEIIVEASCSMLKQAGLDPAETDWVEVGAEPGGTLLDDSQSSFRSVSTIGIGQEIEIPPQAIVFSNELFDAQTFRQIRFDGSQWIEFAVQLQGKTFVWKPRPTISDEAAFYTDDLPSDLPSGYTVDLPTGSLALARNLIERNWSGAFIAFDYGKTWHSIAQDTPQGSARGYYLHKQRPDILDAPGSMDITHHICWDHLETALKEAGFSKPSLQSQESFIVHRAPNYLQKAFDPTLPAFAPIRQKLKELMHPALMGQKFQALSAIRLPDAQPTST